MKDILHDIAPMLTSIREIFFSFDGRIGRKTFWLSIISLFIVAGVVVDIKGKIQADQLVSVVLFVLLVVGYFFFFWAILAIQIKRWHDRNKSGLWVFISAIPYIGSIWAIIELGFLKGTTGTNQYGDDPLLNEKKKQPSSDEAIEREVAELRRKSKDN